MYLLLVINTLRWKELNTSYGHIIYALGIFQFYIKKTGSFLDPKKKNS